ncbi:MAG: hypothetical protein ACRDVE_03280 [Actinocrinis sp.]
MAYPQPGQYPAYPQYPGSFGQAPLPKTVRNAFYLMLSGAVLRLISGIVTLASVSKLRDRIRSNQPDFTPAQIDNAVHAGEAFVVISIVIGMGLWIWMAFANKRGANWARITGTVFFGVECLGLVIGLAASGSSGLAATKDSAFGTVLSVIEWVIGLAAVILLWNKQSAPHFSKVAQYGGAPYPYPYPIPPQQPPVPGAPVDPQQPYGTAPQQPYGTQQPPSDPWSNPNPPQQ